MIVYFEDTNKYYVKFSEASENRILMEEFCYIVCFKIGIHNFYWFAYCCNKYRLFSTEEDVLKSCWIGP